MNACLNGNSSSNRILKTKNGSSDKSKCKTEQWQKKLGHVEGSWDIIENVGKDEHFQGLTNDNNGKTGNTANLIVKLKGIE